MSITDAKNNTAQLRTCAEPPRYLVDAPTILRNLCLDDEPGQNTTSYDHWGPVSVANVLVLSS